jgi:hypothetical protein
MAGGGVINGQRLMIYSMFPIHGHIHLMFHTMYNRMKYNNRFHHTGFLPY